MKISVVTIHQATTNLSRLLQKASSGEEVIISRGSTACDEVGETCHCRGTGSGLLFRASLSKPANL